MAGSMTISLDDDQMVAFEVEGLSYVEIFKLLNLVYGELQAKATEELGPENLVDDEAQSEE